ncbi:MAG: U32 family peptidase [Candidatus Altiarchaeota archaeon]|nr:U32 family peptidase [Candidatus Altiarchaeota archaeon]
MSSVELLSPAGDWDSLKAAVENGADAVYLGVGRFNARRRAENFTEEDLPKVTSFCHDRGVRVHLAANTLVKNDELSAYFKLIGRAYDAGVDVIIVQDLAFISIIKENFPGIEVHASTQASIFNSLYGNILGGVDRVILPREFTVSQVKEFRQKTGIPVEVFVQGALCFSISGQCLMSSFLGGRSGNRGLCAQPCRKKYNSGFVLSTKDLCLVEKITPLIEAGISAFKIEGRLRSPDYVAAATYLYRKAIDTGEVDPEALFDTRLSFSRGYTLGMMFRQSDVVSPEASGKRGVFLGKLGDGGIITLSESLQVGDGVGIVSGKKICGDVIRRIECNGRDVHQAEAGRRVKLHINAKPCDEVFITSAASRRKPYWFPKKERLVVSRHKSTDVRLPKAEDARLVEPRLLVKVYSLSDAFLALYAGALRVYYNVLAKDYPTEDKRISPYVPRCLSEWNASAAIETVRKINPLSVLSGDLGVASSLKGYEVYLNVSGNVFNEIDVRFWNDRGVIPVISPELSLRELKEFKDKRFGVYVHGRVPLMTSKYQLREESLQDELGYVFPVRAEADYKQVVNSVPLELYGGVLKLADSGIVQYLLDLEERVGETVLAYQRILSGEEFRRPRKEYTLGHFRKGVE